MFFFGPHSGPLPLPNEEVDEDSFCQPSSVTKKHGRDAEINGIEFDQSTQHPSKKSRRSKSQGAESNEPNDHGDAMDIDRNGYSHAEPSPKADTPAPSSPAAEAEVAQELQELQEPEPTNTLTNGNSVGVQSDKVIELGPETCLFLDLGETKGNPTTNGTSSNKNHDDATSYDRGIIGSGTTNGLGANGVGGVGPSGGNVGVTHLAWNPRDPAILATAGNALSRIWTLNGLASTTENGGHVNINGNGFDDAAQTNGHTLETEGTDYINLIASSERSLTTACSWSPDGETLAVATRDLTAHWDGEATIWSRDGRMLHVLPAGHDMMLALQWNPVASLLLGIATTGESSTILLWDSSTGQLLTESTSTESLTDAAWMTETDFVCCGDTRMMRYRISIDGATPTILVLQDIKTEVKWLGLRCDVAQDIIASIADEDGLIGVCLLLLPFG